MSDCMCMCNGRAFVCVIHLKECAVIEGTVAG